MKMASLFAAFLLSFAISIPAYVAGTKNVGLEVGISSL